MEQTHTLSTLVSEHSVPRAFETFETIAPLYHHAYYALTAIYKADRRLQVTVRVRNSTGSGH